MTAVEWYISQMFQLNESDYKSKRQYLSRRVKIEKMAKQMEEEGQFKEYMKGYQHGWRECDAQIKNDIKILNNKYNL